MGEWFPTLRLSILVTREGEGFLAHCLELDIAEGGKTREEAIENVIDTCIAHTCFAVEDDDLEHLFKPAPSAYWARFYAARPGQAFQRGLQIPSDPAVKTLSARDIDAQVCYA